ncbi:polyprenyl synthetase family protein [Fulvivirgaceae bacterium BMA10]|uniref:Polyprenyl synthetase family protein n=1 Tax=Splendidivirga corallicola TaxID=3051826 RepID=A0ABT8KT23_9BACT|nr:polyprenyl synthetase family protein [Fulvivirgaceae bacterium BMA10]
MKLDINNLSELINDRIAQLDFGDKPLELYEPIRYIMQLGGKRMRPILAILGYSLFDENSNNIIEPAIAVEVFHNFTLMHDDIMDRAPIRRGKATVHEKWNDNVAILSGDVMLVKAYDLLLKSPDDRLKKVLLAFNKCASEVCEGQQFDMNFETKDDVSVEDYLEMIRLKTAVLLGFSLELGAILGGADHVTCQHLKQLGTDIGIGFQLKDDLLDVFGDQNKFGKQVGGDIIANKKTFLLIKALENAKGNTKQELRSWLEKKDFDKTEKVLAIKGIYDQLDIQKITQQKINEYFDAGLKRFKALEIAAGKKEHLIGFINKLMNREK